MATEEKKETSPNESSESEQIKLAEKYINSVELTLKNEINLDDNFIGIIINYLKIKCSDCEFIVPYPFENLVQYGPLGTLCKCCNEIEKEKRYFRELGTYYD